MIRRLRRFAICYRLWRRLGLPIMAAIKATRRYHRRFLGL